jgi:hypothetical protein
LLRLLGIDCEFPDQDSDELADALFASFIPLSSLLAFDFRLSSFLLGRKLFFLFLL